MSAPGLSSLRSASALLSPHAERSAVASPRLAYFRWLARCVDWRANRGHELRAAVGDAQQPRCTVAAETPSVVCKTASEWSGCGGAWAFVAASRAALACLSCAWSRSIVVRATISEWLRRSFSRMSGCRTVRASGPNATSSWAIWRRSSPISCLSRSDIRDHRMACVVCWRQLRTPLRFSVLVEVVTRCRGVEH